jgi:hypothetical protein
MPRLKVWLAYWEHDCCGPIRIVGEEVTMDVATYDGRAFESRHDQVTGTARIHGRLVGIEWHAAEMEMDGIGRRITGYGPGVSLTSTNDDRPDADAWAFEFTVATTVSIPGVIGGPR